MTQQDDSQDVVPISGLDERDAAVLDAIVAARARGAATGPLPPDSAARAQTIARLLDVIEQDPIEPAPDDLTARTLARVQAIRQQRRFAEQVEMLREPRRSVGVDWRQLVSAAAIFLVACSLVMPVLSRTRADARRIACAGNLATAGSAFGAYAADFAGMLPRGAVKPGAVWWNVGQTNGQTDDGEIVTSNSAHLFLLVRHRYTDAQSLACPSNAHAHRHDLSSRQRDWPTPQAVSFSYQNQYTADPIRLDRQRDLPLLADRNPLFVSRGNRVTFDREASVLSSSRSHDQRGQNILISDGTVRWTVRPTVSRGRTGQPDNIWVVAGVTQYTGREVPAQGDGEVESFLVP